MELSGPRATADILEKASPCPQSMKVCRRNGTGCRTTVGYCLCILAQDGYAEKTPIGGKTTGPGLVRINSHRASK
jgi:hypothetical protein